MSESENFLARWSRRKQVADKPAPLAQETAGENAAPGAVAESKPAGTPAVPLEEPFDPASLPSLDSIGAETDITGFLKAGVPGDLKLAALRRAWTADPVIRNFKGLAENDWDFTAPNSQMGFGEIDPSLDLKKMLSDIFGDAPKEKPADEAPVDAGEAVAEPAELRTSGDRLALSSAAEAQATDPVRLGSNPPEVVLQRNTNLQDGENENDELPVKPRPSHGGALPQ